MFCRPPRFWVTSDTSARSTRRAPRRSTRSDRAARQASQRSHALIESLEPRVLLASCPALDGSSATTHGMFPTAPGQNLGVLSQEITVEGSYTLSTRDGASGDNYLGYHLDVYKVEGVPGQFFTVTYRNHGIDFRSRGYPVITDGSLIGQVLGIPGIGTSVVYSFRQMGPDGFAYVAAVWGPEAGNGINLETGCRVGQQTWGNGNSADDFDLGTYSITITPDFLSTTPPSLSVTDVNDNTIDPTDDSLRVVDLAELTAGGVDQPIYVKVDISDSNGVYEPSLSDSTIRAIPPLPSQDALVGVFFSADTNGTNDTLESAVYRIDPPAGGWTQDYVGHYDVETNDNRIRDTSGAAASGTVAAFGFDVSADTPRGKVIDLDPPDGAADFTVDLAELATDGGDQPLRIRVNFTDDDGIKESSIANSQLTLMPDSGASLAAVVESIVTAGGDDMVETVIYRVDAPAGGWTPNPELPSPYVQTYDVRMSAGGTVVEDINGKTVEVGSVLGMIEITAVPAQVTLLPVDDIELGDPFNEYKTVRPDFSLIVHYESEAGISRESQLEFSPSATPFAFFVDSTGEPIEFAKGFAPRLFNTVEFLDGVSGEHFVTSTDVEYTFSFDNDGRLLYDAQTLLHTFSVKVDSESPLHDKNDEDVSPGVKLGTFTLVDTHAPVPVAQPDLAFEHGGDRGFPVIDVPVTWLDGGAVDVAKLGNDDIIARRISTGPAFQVSFMIDGEPEPDSAVDEHEVLARYRIDPYSDVGDLFPSGEYLFEDHDGIYAIEPAGSQVFDMAGNAVAAGAVQFGTLTVDTTPPSYALDDDRPEPGEAQFVVSVVIRDELTGIGDNIDVEHIGWEVRPVDGEPLNIASVTEAPVPGDEKAVMFEITVDAPGGAWDDADRGEYEVRQTRGAVPDKYGNSKDPHKIGSFFYGSATQAALIAPMDVVDFDSIDGTTTPIPIQVRYSNSETGLDADSLLASKIALTNVDNPGSPIQLTATNVVSTMSSGNKVVEAIVEYSFARTSGTWAPADLGTREVRPGSPSVLDADGGPMANVLIGKFLVSRQPKVFVTMTTPPSYAGQTIVGPADRTLFGTIQVRYGDSYHWGIDASTIGPGDLYVVSADNVNGPRTPLDGTPQGEPAPDEFAAAYVFGNGGILTAPYSDAAQGRYLVRTAANQISNTLHNDFIDADQTVAEIVIDFTPPTASLLTTTRPSNGATEHIVTIDWFDALSGIDTATLSAPEVVVGANGPASYTVVDLGVTPTADPMHVQQRFSIRPSDGKWDTNDVGTITVRIAQTVRDRAGNELARGGDAVGSFDFTTGLPVALDAGGGLGLSFTSSSGRQIDIKISKDNIDFAAELVGQEIQERTEKKVKKIFGGLVDSIGTAIINSTSAKSTVQIQGKGKGERIVVDNVVATGSYSKLDLKDVNIGQNLDASGGIAMKIVVGDVRDDHLIEIGAPMDGIEAIDIVMDRVANTDLISLTPIRSLTVTEWIDDDGDPDQIIAPWIGKIIVKGNKKENIAGDFEADLILSGVDAPKGVALGSATIPGSLREAVWDLGGASGAITVKTDVSDVTIDADGGIKSLKLGDVSNTSVTALDEINSIQAARWLDGQVTTPHLSALKITGDRKRNIPGDSSVDLVLDGLDNGKPRLGSTSISGSLLASAWTVYGDGKGVSVSDTVNAGFAATFGGELKSFTAKGPFNGLLSALSLGGFSALSMDGASVHVGTSAGADGIFGNGDDKVQFATLKSIKVKDGASRSLITVGVASGNGTFLDGDDDFVGGEIKSITLGDLDNDSTFATGLFPASVKVGKDKVDPAQDDRFVAIEYGT